MNASPLSNTCRSFCHERYYIPSRSKNEEAQKIKQSLVVKEYNNKSLKVKDIFKKKFVSTTPNATLNDAAKLIFGEHHKGLPVVEGKYKKLVGFISEQDITSEMFPSISDLMEDYVHERDFEAMEMKIKPVLQKKVKDIMSKRVTYIHLEDPILKAESIMKVKGVGRLPVVDDKKHVIGIISKGDIFRALVSPKVRGFK